jgi:hypothetical protein
MKSIKEMTQGELAAFIQSHLREKGIDVVLSGGALLFALPLNTSIIFLNHSRPAKN